MNTVCIYSLCEPDDDSNVRYVGKTNDMRIRYNHHLRLDERNGKVMPTRKNNWISKLLTSGKKPIMKLIEIVPEDCWKDFETFYIKQYRDQGFDLTNLTDGGEGAGIGEKHHNFGKKLVFSKERNKKISEAKKGKCSASPEQIEKLRIMNLGNQYGKARKGLKQSEETKRKISAKAIGRPSKMKGIPRPPHVIEKMRYGYRKFLESKKQNI